jgi:hypothetical protein
MSNLTELKKFFDLNQKSRRAALDVSVTGEVSCLYTRNQATGEEGRGTPGEPMSDRWERVARADFGRITPGG